MPSSLSLRPLGAIALGLAILALPTACTETSGGAAARTTAQLEQVFPQLEAYQVIAFRHDNWCQAIEYKRGRYASSSGKACISILSGSRRPFDQAARRDHATILTAIRDAHDKIHLLKGFRYDSEGRIEFGIFDCGSGDGDLVYVFSRKALDLETPVDGHPLTAVSETWYRSK